MRRNRFALLRPLPDTKKRIVEGRKVGDRRGRERGAEGEPNRSKNYGYHSWCDGFVVRLVRC